jgi:hypothetical protein
VDANLFAILYPEEFKRKQEEAALQYQEYLRLIGENKSPYSFQGMFSGVEPVSGIAGGGRLSREFQLTPEQRMILGISGGGMLSGKSGVPSEFKATALDMMIQNKNNGYGIQYNRPSPMSNIPRWMFNYYTNF